MRFTDAHSPSAVCTPTRYALLTDATLANSTATERLGPWDKPLIAADRLTVGQLLQQRGYATACIGKWHLGQNYSTTDGKPPAGGVKNPLSNVDFTQPVADGPITRGFDHYFGTIVPNYPPYCFIEDDRTVGTPSVQTSGGNFNIPGPMVPGWKLEDILPGLTRHAVEWVNDQAKTQETVLSVLLTDVSTLSGCSFVGVRRQHKRWCLWRLCEANGLERGAGARCAGRVRSRAEHAGHLHE